MTYVTPYFNFKNSFDRVAMIKIGYISGILNVHRPFLFITVGLITHDLIYEMVYLFAKPLELLIHRLGGLKYVVSGICGCSNMFVIIRNSMVYVRRTGTFLGLNK